MRQPTVTPAWDTKRADPLLDQGPLLSGSPLGPSVPPSPLPCIPLSSHTQLCSQLGELKKQNETKQEKKKARNNPFFV